MKIGLFFGSFNPVHIGHLIIAEYMAEHTDLNQVWFVVSPHNPLKKKSSLANDYDRLHLVNIAIEDNPRLSSSSVEFGLPQPSYTVDTMAYLQEKYPNHEFALIMGGDNLESIHKWKNYETLLNNYNIYVYARKGSDIPDLSANITIADAPMMNISATYIRNQIKASKSIKYLVPDGVLEHIELSGLYKQ